MWFRRKYGPALLVGLAALLSPGCSLERIWLRETASEEVVIRAQAPELKQVSSDGKELAPAPDSPDQIRVWAEAQEREAAAPPATVWGLAGIRGFAFGQQVAPNGFAYDPLFSVDLDFNMMLWRQHNVYLFADTRFWGQKPGGGNTNASQGAFDFSKRQFDFDLGLAWNYYAGMEARAFAYSLANLNRGKWQNKPSGFNDGIGLENRWYFDPTYAELGTAAFDTARATFASVGAYPTKDMVDNEGFTFKPGVFARAYLTCDLGDERCYLFLDTQLLARRPINPKLLRLDGGVALRPFASHPRLEFRLGSEDTYDRQWDEWVVSFYGSIRYVF